MRVELADETKQHSGRVTSVNGANVGCTVHNEDVSSSAISPVSLGNGSCTTGSIPKSLIGCSPLERMPTHTLFECKRYATTDPSLAGTPNADDPLSPPVFDLSTASINTASCIIVDNAELSKRLPFIGGNPGAEHKATDVFTGLPSYNTGSVAPICPSFNPHIIVHNPIFDDPKVRGKFTEATLSSGWFWHKESSSIVEGVAEISSGVTSQISCAAAAGLFEVINE